MNTTATTAELLEGYAAREAARAAAGRERAAELAILTRYDLTRHVLGHDYGNGQRGAELRRLEHDLDGDLVTLAYVAAGIELPDSMVARAGAPLELAELEAAYQRVGAPRRRRIIAREGYRTHTEGTRRTLRAWSAVERWVNGTVA